MSRIIVGLVGQRRVGKDTVADYMCSRMSFRKIAVADPLKKIVREIFDFTEAQVNGPEKETVDESWGISPRIAMQFVGTDMFRDVLGNKFPSIGDNIWAMHLARQLAPRVAPLHIVVSDIRFPNEARVIRDAGGFLIGIKRHRDRVGSDPDTVGAHASETQSETIVADYNIVNDSSFADLFAAVDHIMEDIRAHLIPDHGTTISK